MIDSNAIKALLKIVEDTVVGDNDMINQVPDAVENGLKLLLVCGCLLNYSFLLCI